jgi:hypothetical protein
MREGKELERTGRVVGGSAAERPERRRPQVEVIHEPNEPDEDFLVDPGTAE